MALPLIQLLSMPAIIDGPALTNTVTATSLIGVSTTAQASAKPILAPQFGNIGCMIDMEAYGRISTVVTTPGTFTFDIRSGAVIVANGGAMALNVVAKTNVTWRLKWSLNLRTQGGGTIATYMHAAEWKSEAVIGSPLPTVGGSGVLLLPASAPAVGTGFDSTAAQTLDLFGTWSIANAANSITLHGIKWRVEYY